MQLIQRLRQSRTLGSAISSLGPLTGPRRLLRTIRSNSSRIFIDEGMKVGRLLIDARFG